MEVALKNLSVPLSIILHSQLCPLCGGYFAIVFLISSTILMILLA